MSAQDSSRGPLYVVEHLEGDDTPAAPIPPWVSLEYRHIGQTVRQAVFSNLSHASRKVLEADMPSSCTCTVTPAEELLKGRRICLLDPKATEPLAPGDAEIFDAFLYGGILGDDPPRDRTAELRRLGYPSRHLGTVQMTTDTAVLVTKLVVEDKQRLDAIHYVDRPTLKFSVHEASEMPFRYCADSHGEPIMPDGMRELIRADMDQAFEI